MDLSTPIRALSGIGSYYSSRLFYLGVKTVEDLLYFFPFRYDDFSKTTSVSELQTGEVATLKGEIWSIKNTYTRQRKVLTTAILNDGTNTIELIWFHQSWLIKTIKPGDILQVSGKVGRKGSKINILVPTWEKVSRTDLGQNQFVHTGRLVPIYSETEGLSSKWIRQKINQILPQVKNQITDPLPSQIKDGMFDLQEAIEKIHFPQTFDEARSAQSRLGFDELFYVQLQTQKRRLEWQQKKLIEPLKIDLKVVTDFIKNLPFKLTAAQNKVLHEILNDLTQTHPMNRLIQGDVGSGKTVVAAILSYIVHLNKLRTVIMAPTEILAFQHHQTFNNLLEPYGLEIGIYTGSRKYNKIRDKRLKIKDPQSLIINHPSVPDILIGTHALLSEKLNLDNVGLIVVDEQQRFGVEQRSILRDRTNSPHFLTMTATPIPRTVALTLYGDLDLSVIDELPPGRKPIKTFFVPHKKRADAYKFITEHIKSGRQVYIITPLIEQSETTQSAKAATVEFETLKKGVFKNFKIGLLHGRLKSKAKEEAINKFKSHEIDILVSTSVVEVGVDVPNATIMMVEGAERFGLAQLHQLRGRVGRGEYESFCLLFTETEIPQVVNRVKNLERINDGLKLSELDLKIRGGGEVFGTAQSGQWNLKIASLSDIRLVEKTRNSALRILVESPSLDKYPQLLTKLHSLGKSVMPD